MTDKLIEFLEQNGYKLSNIILILLIIFIITNIENILIFKSWFFGLFSNLFSFAKKKQMSNKVRGTILKAIKEQSLSDEYILPSDMRIIWVNEEKIDSFVENNQVIVRIKQSSNPHENLITALSEYVNNGLLYNVKRYLNKEVMDVSCILTVRNVIKSANSVSLMYLDENYITPKINSDIELNELYHELMKIDKNGMFVGVMLNEFYKAGMTIYGDIEDPELKAESKEFMRFLYNIAIRLSNEVSDLCFNRDYFKVAIFLTASNKTLKSAGIQPFIKAISHKLNEGIETIYIFGLGAKREIAEQISKELDSDFRISKIKKHSYRHVNDNGKRIPGVFFECEIFKDGKDTN